MPAKKPHKMEVRESALAKVNYIIERIEELREYHPSDNLHQAQQLLEAFIDKDLEDLL